MVNPLQSVIYKVWSITMTMGEEKKKDLLDKGAIVQRDYER